MHGNIVFYIRIWDTQGKVFWVFCVPHSTEQSAGHLLKASPDGIVAP